MRWERLVNLHAPVCVAKNKQGEKKRGEGKRFLRKTRRGGKRGDGEVFVGFSVVPPFSSPKGFPSVPCENTENLLEAADQAKTN